MRVLVLGGTGAIGAHLVGLLAKHGCQVVVTSRTRSGHCENIEYVIGNAKDMRFITALLSQHWDVIVDFMVYTTASFKSRCAQFLNATGHYIFLSSSRVYADTDRPITENTPRLLDVTEDQDYLALDEYALSKARQEDLLIESGVKNWSIVRPYIAYSDQRLQLGVLEKEDWLYRSLKGRSIVTSKDIQSKYTTLTFGRDVARGIVAILGQSKALGEAFHITSDKTITWAEVLEIYLSVLEKYLFKRPSVVLQELEIFLKWRVSQYQVVYDRLYNRQFDNTKINQYIDTKLFVQPEFGLKESLKNFLNAEKIVFNSINWKAEAIKDLLLSECASLSEPWSLKQKIIYFMYRNLPLALTTRRFVR